MFVCCPPLTCSCSCLWFLTAVRRGNCSVSSVDDRIFLLLHVVVEESGWERRLISLLVSDRTKPQFGPRVRSYWNQGLFFNPHSVITVQTHLLTHVETHTTEGRRSCKQKWSDLQTPARLDLNTTHQTSRWLLHMFFIQPNQVTKYHS